MGSQKDEKSTSSDYVKRMEGSERKVSKKKLKMIAYFICLGIWEDIYSSEGELGYELMIGR